MKYYPFKVVFVLCIICNCGNSFEVRNSDWTETNSRTLSNDTSLSYNSKSKAYSDNQWIHKISEKTTQNGNSTAASNYLKSKVNAIEDNNLNKTNFNAIANAVNKLNIVINTAAPIQVIQTLRESVYSVANQIRLYWEQFLNYLNLDKLAVTETARQKPQQQSFIIDYSGVNRKGSKRQKRRKGYKVKKRYKKFMLPLLIAYKLKFLTMVPIIISGLILLAGSTGMAGFFFALFTAVISIKYGQKH